MKSLVSRVQRAQINELTEREKQVFVLIGKGKKKGDIAKVLKVSINTVEVHRMKLKKKLGLKDGWELMHLAIRWSLS